MKKKSNSPLLIICFNRPLKLKNLLKVISKNTNKISKIYFKIDGPRNLNDKKKILEIIKILRDFSSSKKIYTVNKKEKKNIGLQKNIIKGVDWVFKSEKKIIVLEDDTIPSNSFFNFCNFYLELFEKKENVMHISGTNFVNNNNNNFYYSKFPDVVGWATWRNRWDKLVRNIDLNKLVKSKKVEKYYYNNKLVCEWFYMYLFREVITYKGLWSTWWALTILINDGISLNPTKNLVFHDGYDLKDNPEHFNKSYLIKKRYKLEDVRKLKYSKKDELYNKKYDDKNFKLIKSVDPFFKRIDLKWKLKFFLIKINVLKLKKKLFHN